MWSFCVYFLMLFHIRHHFLKQFFFVHWFELKLLGLVLQALSGPFVSVWMSLSSGLLTISSLTLRVSVSPAISWWSLPISCVKCLSPKPGFPKGDGAIGDEDERTPGNDLIGSISLYKFMCWSMTILRRKRCMGTRILSNSQRMNFHMGLCSIASISCLVKDLTHHSLYLAIILSIPTICKI